MKKEINEKASWTICTECKGRGKKNQRLRKKVRLHYQNSIAEFEKSNREGLAPIPPKSPLVSPLRCICNAAVIKSQSLDLKLVTEKLCKYLFGEQFLQK